MIYWIKKNGKSVLNLLMLEIFQKILNLEIQI